jgi:hypothetical protein
MDLGPTRVQARIGSWRLDDRRGDKLSLLRDWTRKATETDGMTDTTSIFRLMRLSLVWFPRDFIPPRERPTDFEEIRNALKL